MNVEYGMVVVTYGFTGTVQFSDGEEVDVCRPVSRRGWITFCDRLLRASSLQLAGPGTTGAGAAVGPMQGRCGEG
jgi:hypothetical protein